MIAAVVLQNVAYVLGAFAGIVIGGLIVTMRHRRPTTVEANMAEFHRGLQALAPDRGPLVVAHRAAPPLLGPSPVPAAVPGVPSPAERAAAAAGRLAREAETG